MAQTKYIHPGHNPLLHLVSPHQVSCQIDTNPKKNTNHTTKELTQVYSSECTLIASSQFSKIKTKAVKNNVRHKKKRKESVEQHYANQRTTQQSNNKELLTSSSLYVSNFKTRTRKLHRKTPSLEFPITEHESQSSPTRVHEMAHGTHRPHRGWRTSGRDPTRRTRRPR